MSRWLAQRGRIRTVFEAVVLLQLAHLGEHVVQIAQIHLLGWSPREARGLVAAFDVERMHFVWNLGVLIALGWLIGRGVRSAALLVTFAWAAAHTAEHGYLVTRATLTGLDGGAGILGHGGWLATLGVSVAGLTTWTRPTVHLVWNVGEVALLTIAYIVWAWARLRQWAREMLLPWVPGVSVGTLTVLVLAFSGTPADQAVTGLAPFEIILDGRNELVGIAVAADDTRYISDRGAGLVYRLTGGGVVTIAADNLDRPAGLALSLDGRLLIVEEHAGRVLQLASNGARTVIASGLKSPRWIVVNDDGSLYVTAHRWTSADGANPDEGRVVVRIDAGGTASEVATGIRAVQGLARVNGSLIVASKGMSVGPESSGVLLRYPILPGGALGAAATWVATGLKQPVGLGIDALQALYVASKELTIESDAAKRAVGKVHPSAHLSDFASNLSDPQGVALGRDGALYVADGKSGRLYRFRAPPAPILGALPRFSRTATLAVSGTTEAGARVDVFMNDATHAMSARADAAGRFAIDVTLGPNQSNDVDVYATTHGGDGLTSPSASAQTLHDDRPPEVTFAALPSGTHVRGVVRLTCAASDKGSGVVRVTLSAAGRPLSPRLDPSPPAARLTASVDWDTTTANDGAQTLSVKAADAVGNESPFATRSVIVDNTPPETAITGGPDAEVAVDAAAFSFTGFDAITAASDLVFAWRLDGGVWSGFAVTTSATLTGLPEGSHTFEVKARDRAGNEDPTPAARSFRVVLGPVLASVTPATGTAGTLVTLSGSGFSPGPVTVAFNGTPAVIRSATAGAVTTTVPVGATTGAVVVTTARGSASRSFGVMTTGDFALRLVPAAATSLPGAQVSYALGVVGTGTFSGFVSIDVSGLPAGVTAEILPATSLAPGQTGELRLSIAPEAAAGPTHLLVTASAVADGIRRSHAATATLTIGAPGQTAVGGRILLASGEPLPGVALTIGEVHATTDVAGNFLLLGPPAGTQMMGIDANAARAGLAIYARTVDVVAGRATILPATWLTPPPPAERFVPIANATADQIVRDPRFPGVAFTLPAGAIITGWDGALKTQIAIERIPLDRLPVPPPPGRTRSLFQLFFGTPMGGVPSAALPVTLPNDLGLDPGSKAQLWYYDAAPLPGVAAAWRLAGLGTVSEDGRTIASDPGVGIARFCGVCGLACFVDNEDAQPSADESGVEDGEPVNLAMGQHLVDAVDLVQPGRIPAVVYRAYNPFDAFGRIAGFELVLGQGWALSVDIALLDLNASVRRLIMPGNARYEFVRQPDGGFVNTTHPRFRGARIFPEAEGVQALRFSNGNTWRFRGSWVGRGRSQPIAGLNLLIEQRDRHDNVLAITRDASGGVTTLTQSDGRTIVFTTSLLVPDERGSARLTQVRDALGRTVQYGYDPTSRRLTSVIDAAGGETRYLYDAAGRIVSIRDQKGVTYVRNVYDTQGRVSRQEMADGGVWQYAYEGPVGAHTVVRVTNPRGFTTTHRLGVGGRGDEVVDPLGQPTRVGRGANGAPIMVIDALGRTSRIEYDASLRPSAAVDREATRWSFTYEPIFGGIETIADPVGNATRFEYDARGNLTARVNPEGDRLEFTYDAAGAPTTVTDALGRTTSYAYDAAGNVASIRDPLGSTATFEHDAGSRLVTAVDPNGTITRWFYDALNRVQHIVDPRGGVSTFGYDPKGNLLTFRDARGRSTTYTYDEMDRLRTRTDPLGRTKTFSFDLNGNVVLVVDPANRTTRHEYDALDRRSRTIYPDGAVVEYFYDAVGRLIRTTDTEAGTILFTYDGQDRLAEELTDQGAVTYAYDAVGRRRRLTVDGAVTIAYQYDRNSRLTMLTQTGYGTASHEYFATGQLRRRALGNGLATRYDYDAVGRVTRLTYEHATGTVIGDLAYDYDTAGRRTSVYGTLARTLLPRAVTASTYDAANQQLRFGDYTATYDANGNATSLLGPDGVTTLTWDSRHRLRRVDSADTVQTFGYDALGRRIRRITADVVSSYQYMGGDIVRETRGGLDLSYLRGLGADETLGQESALAYLIDGTRSTIGLVDDTGAVTQTFAYEPFGLGQTSGAVDRARYQFTGRERDADWLYYYRARYYSPRLARFLQPDPLGRAGGANLYAYAANNPLSFVDPSGLRTYTVHGCCQNERSLEDWGAFSRKLVGGDPDVRIFDWSGSIFFDVFPSTGRPSKALLDQILRDLAAEPLAPGEKLNLVGHSAGGIIINNVGNALRARGIPVDNIILMGTPLYPGTLNAAMPSDVQITNFDDTFDPLSTTKNGPNVMNIPVANQTAAGTVDALTAHTGYAQNAAVINIIKTLIAK
jgi:RHS repeat-associated protein